MSVSTTETQHSCDATLLAGKAKVTLPVVFKTSKKDPWAVTLILGSDSANVSWVFDKELLEKGTKTPTGLGAVCCWPDDEQKKTHITLNNDRQSATIAVETTNIITFLEQTPDDTESQTITEKQLENFLKELNKK